MEEKESHLQIPKPPATALPKPSFMRWCVDESSGDGEELENFDLPLLRSKPEPDSPRSNAFRQRSVVPTALGTALDIKLRNASLVFISVTFAIMCKSASPIFLLVFAFAFRLESPSIKLLGIILVISIGVLLTVAKETQFEFWGFLFVMLAAVMSGFRWCMTQILLQKEAYGLKNPITLISYVTPVMTVTTAIGSLVLDPWHNLSENMYFDSSTHIIRSCLLMLLGGALAFFMVLTEYILVSATSAITVTVAGTIKESVTFWLLFSTSMTSSPC